MGRPQETHQQLLNWSLYCRTGKVGKNPSRLSSDQTETSRSLQVSMVILTDSQSKLWWFLFSRVIKCGERRPVDKKASPPRRPQHPAYCLRDMKLPLLNEDLLTLTVMNSAHLILPPGRKRVCVCGWPVSLGVGGVFCQTAAICINASFQNLRGMEKNPSLILNVRFSMWIKSWHRTIIGQFWFNQSKSFS